jgi:tripartite-type tricarboxylate transporter receptor subunit TctC
VWWLASQRSKKGDCPTNVRWRHSRLPKEVVDTLAAEIAKAARSPDTPDTRQHLLDHGAEPVGNSPEEFAKIMKEEVVRWAQVVRISGARAD